MTNRLSISPVALCSLGGLVISASFAGALSAAPYASSLSPARQAAQRKAFAGAAGAYAPNARAASQQRTNFIGKSQIPVATKPTMQVPIATKPQMQIPYQKTPAPSVVTPPMIRTQNYEPASIVGFYPEMKTVLKAANQQARTGDTRKPIYKRVNLHPERAWQNSTTGTSMAFKRRGR
jgi:hypothetical protein